VGKTEKKSWGERTKSAENTTKYTYLAPPKMKGGGGPLKRGRRITVQKRYPEKLAAEEEKLPRVNANHPWEESWITGTGPGQRDIAVALVHWRSKKRGSGIRCGERRE